ncbi:flagellar basal body-associated FliL family protein [Notoacmeibacter sp. MSK16QG-6]|uniref:flagellar basal body-associated FliL family protein n=1 Tax=Notoacmeibacter sp. MSK16QG-6 TaxID=2957982 RepID=UPI0020A101B0|nr:flagellar basal body-associated FliL family protein [Notoacmeibacter sp. MSK16QG-6]MCP1200921.1 flagellar basal body-associated FliL family protein [Notoacmeibacter sp. MSK16QG-6]
MPAKDKSKNAKPGIVKTLVLPVAIMLIVGGGVGFGVGSFVLAPRMKAGQEMASANNTPAAELADGQAQSYAPSTQHGALDGLTQDIVDLEPITVNLAVPADVLMRLQIAVETSSTVSEGTLNDVHQDILAYVRQLRLDQLRSPNGYLRIRDDLTRRAKVRSEGGVSKLYIRTLVFE